MRVPEFVVYNPQQYVPRYVLAVRQVPRDAPTALGAAAPPAAAAVAPSEAAAADASIARLAAGFIDAEVQS